MEQNFLVEQFVKGGAMMWPLLLCSLLALAFIIERMWVVWSVPGPQQAEKELDHAEQALLTQGEKGAAEHFRRGRGVLNYIFAALLKRYDSLLLENRQDLEDMRQELIATTEEGAVDYLGRHLNGLGTIGVVAPLLGLLGTITGMIRAFEAIARAGVGDPGAVAGGISEALITTASGLIIAIPTVVMHRYLTGRADKLFKRIELYCHAFANTLLTRGPAQQAPASRQQA
jgi:biopolymer transport protein ExbB